MTITRPAPSSEQILGLRIDALVHGVARHWLALVNGILGVLTSLPWLAPVLMHAGWQGAAALIYGIYSLLCHQLPERSWFLFGSNWTPTLAQINRVSGADSSYLALRRFIGDPAMGWKLAWSDRMVSFYGGLFVFGLLFALIRRAQPAWRGISWCAAFLLLVPIFADGLTHVELPGQIDTTALLGDAVAQKVAYVPGREFFVEGQPIRSNCMRLSFGGATPEKIHIGMDRLAKVIQSKL
jgi:uncharacterized membrane protein